MCSGRVDLEFIFRSFANGQDGVFIGGCKLGECNYATQGNFDAYANTLLSKKILSYLGVDPERLRITFMNASDGILLAETVTEFSKKVRELGPLGQGEGLDLEALRQNVAAVRKIIPYLRLVERERLRVPQKSRQDYEEFYSSPEMDRLFKELVADKLEMAKNTGLLGRDRLTTTEIAERLGLKPSQVAKHIAMASKQGLVKFDPQAMTYGMA